MYFKYISGQKMCFMSNFMVLMHMKGIFKRSNPSKTYLRMFSNSMNIKPEKI